MHAKYTKIIDTLTTVKEIVIRSLFHHSFVQYGCFERHLSAVWRHRACWFGVYENVSVFKDSFCRKATTEISAPREPAGIFLPSSSHHKDSTTPLRIANYVKYHQLITCIVCTSKQPTIVSAQLVTANPLRKKQIDEKDVYRKPARQWLIQIFDEFNQLLVLGNSWHSCGPYPIGSSQLPINKCAKLRCHWHTFPSI